MVENIFPRIVWRAVCLVGIYEQARERERDRRGELITHRRIHVTLMRDMDGVVA